MRVSWQYVLRRWASVLSCGVIAALAWSVLFPLTKPVWAYASDAVATIPVPWLLPAVCLLLLAGCWPSAHGRWWAFLGLCHPLRYPPIWVSVIVGLLVLTIPSWQAGSIWNEAAALRAQSQWWVEHTHPVGKLVLYPGLPLVVVLSVWSFLTSKEQRRPKQRNGQSFRDIKSYDDLVTWIQTDQPISHRDQDAFGHANLARRIARRLIKAIEKGEPPQATTILGQQGSGKSSLLSLVKEELAPHPEIEIVGLSLWPYDTPEGAIAGILDALRDAIGQHASTLALTRIRSNYIDAMAQTGGSWGAFIHLLRSDDSPEQIVHRFNHIAKAIGVQFVLWLEDIERYTNEDLLTDQTESEKRQMERLTPVYALLYLLDDCDAITVVISTGDLRIRFDRQKITRFVERMPSLDHEDIWRWITIIRSKALGDKAVIDPASSDHREKLRMPDPVLEETRYWIWFWNTSDDQPSIQWSIAMLLSTPRTLKVMLRQVIDAWDVLKGEIDFDDLLVVSTIRAAEPNIFSYIEDNIRRIQSGYQNSSFSPGRPSPDYGGDGLKKLLEEVIDPRRRAAIRSCIEFVFPRVFEDYDRDMWGGGLRRILKVYGMSPVGIATST